MFAQLGPYTLPGVYAGDCRELMKKLPDGSVHCVVTSPPYYGLRAYVGEQRAIWGGRKDCKHDWSSAGLSRDTGSRHGGEGSTLDGGMVDLPKHEHTKSDRCSLCGAWRGGLGMEPTPDLYIEHLVEVFREVRRVLRDDGTVWIVIGDCFCNDARGGIRPAGGEIGNDGRYDGEVKQDVSGLKPSDLMMIPHRLALALQRDGWWIRQANVWVKGLSFCPAYAGSVMPESVQGVRWERCRVKVKSAKIRLGQANACDGNVDGIPRGSLVAAGGNPDRQATWADCPGCEKCRANGGYVLRRGSGRPTSSCEMVFLLAKSEKYFYDTEGVKETSLRAGDIPGGSKKTVQLGDRPNLEFHASKPVESSRNLRSAWAINAAPFRGGHYASFPPALVVPCVKAGTSEKGVCATCGAPWARVIDKPTMLQVEPSDLDRFGNGDAGVHRKVGQAYQNWRNENPNRAAGWLPTCSCPRADPVPAVVLDPFAGAGTTPVVATALGRLGLGFDISEEYVTKFARPYLSKWREVAVNLNAGRSKAKEDATTAELWSEETEA